MDFLSFYSVFVALTKTMKYFKTLGEQCNILVCKNIHVWLCVYIYEWDEQIDSSCQLKLLSLGSMGMVLKWKSCCFKVLEMVLMFENA